MQRPSSKGSTGSVAERHRRGALTHRGERVISLFGRAAPHRRIRAALLMAVIVFLSVGRRAGSAPAEPAATADEIAVALVEALTSIESIRCDYTQVITERNRPPLETRWRYAREGGKWHLAEFRSEPDQATEEHIICFDGEQVYSYSITHFSDGTSKTGLVEIQDPHGTPFMSPENLLGMETPNQLGPLTALVRSYQPRVIGGPDRPRDMVGAGVVLRLDDVSKGIAIRGHDMKSTIFVAIDPEHGFLPSEIHVQVAPETREFSGDHRDWFQRWRVLEFNKVLDELAQTERWFPVRGLLIQGGVPKAPDRGPTIELALENVQLNARLDPRLFDPTVEKGTTVLDTTAKGRGRITVAGGADAAQERVAELVERARKADQVRVDDESQRKTPSTWGVWIIAGNLIVLIAIGILLLWQSRAG